MLQTPKRFIGISLLMPDRHPRRLATLFCLCSTKGNRSIDKKVSRIESHSRSAEGMGGQNLRLECLAPEPIVFLMLSHVNISQ